jgi:uncharacterized Zn finger protein
LRETDMIEIESVPCPQCGSKRTSEIAPTPDKRGTIWCHACGAVAESGRRFEGDVIADQVDEWLTADK